MFAVRFFRLLRVPIAASSSCPCGRATPTPSSTPLYAHPVISYTDHSLISVVRFRKIPFFKAWIKVEAANTPELCTVTKSSFKSVALRKACEYVQKLRDPGCKFSVGTTVCGVLGSIILWSPISYCLEGFHPLADYPQAISTDSSSREKFDGIVALIQKLLVPFLLVLNLWLNWGQSHPFFLMAKVTLVFLTTKPFRSSVYLVVDRLRRQIMNRRPFLYGFKPPQAKTVEVEDYTLLCLARVEIKDENLVLIGILGGWWILPWSSHKEVVLFEKSSWKEYEYFSTSYKFQP